MGAPDFFYRFMGRLRSIPSFRHSGRSDKSQCRGSSLEDVDARESEGESESQRVYSRPKIKKDKLQELAIRGACYCNGG